MLTLHYSPQSRATRVNALLHAMDRVADVQIRTMDIIRHDGTGRRDPRNPHPEGKVPALDTGSGLMTESNAIMLYLTDHFASPMGPGPGHPDRGAYLTWMTWASGVQEPCYIALAGGYADNAATRSAYRGVTEIADRLDTALAHGPWLLGEHFSAADLLVSSVYHWAPQWIPDRPAVRAWVARCAAHPSQVWADAQDRIMLAA